MSRAMVAAAAVAALTVALSRAHGRALAVVNDGALNAALRGGERHARSEARLDALEAATRPNCDTCEGVGFTEPAAFMTPDGEVPPRCPDCGGSGQAPRCALHAAPGQEHAPGEDAR